MNPINIVTPTSLKLILILPSHLCLGFPSCFFPSDLLTKILNAQVKLILGMEQASPVAMAYNDTPSLLRVSVHCNIGNNFITSLATSTDH